MSTILIVDDHLMIRKILRKLLEQRLDSVVCVEAIDGLDAIAKAEACCPDLVILDLYMPEMNGFQAAAAIHKVTPEVPLFMLTSDLTREVESQAACVGIRSVFSKETAITALLDRACEVLLRPDGVFAG
jgi:DNA-binding NarL/FixJ family response regulator